MVDLLTIMRYLLNAFKGKSMLRLYYTATTMTVIPEDTNNTEKKSYKKNKKKLVKVLSTKLSIEDYNEFAILTKLAYQDGQIKRPAPSELLRLMIVYLTNACRNEITKGFI